jgi:septal ring factor EnvC (AmiA/AmiB activator)
MLLVGLLLGISLAGFAQNRKDLEEKRKKIVKDIQLTDKMLKKTAKTKEVTLDRFLALQNQIESRESLIRNVDEEIGAAETSIERNNGVVQSLSVDIEHMQAEYSRMVRNAYRHKTLSNPLLYILSADNLNQAFRRWLFLRKYDRFRKEQSEAIVYTRSMLSKRIKELEQTRIEKENLLVYLQGQRSTLTSEMVDKNNLLKGLEQNESKLRQDLQEKQQAHENLNQAIEKVIQEEVRKRVEEARRTKPAVPVSPPPKPETPIVSTNKEPAAAPKTKSNVNAAPATANEDVSSSSFRLKRGKLPWPVDNGFISRGYGPQKHPTLKNIEITNNGIDIRTDESADVVAVAEGIVAGVQFIPGHDYTVILQHGDYYTVYSNLSVTRLGKGDRIAAKQMIGKVSSNPITGSSELHFELWHEKERMNPSVWIRK